MAYDNKILLLASGGASLIAGYYCNNYKLSTAALGGYEISRVLGLKQDSNIAKIISIITPIAIGIYTGMENEKGLYDLYKGLAIGILATIVTSKTNESDLIKYGRRKFLKCALNGHLAGLTGRLFMGVFDMGTWTVGVQSVLLYAVSKNLNDAAAQRA